MAIDLNPIADPTKVGGFNTNFEKIEEEFNENVLRRDGVSPGEANQMEVDLDMNGNNILNVETDLDDPNSLVSLGDADTRYVLVEGDTMTGSLNMGGFGVTNLRTPTQANEATRKDYVDQQVGQKVSKSGDSMSGELAMTDNAITGLPAPSSDNDAARKKYVDDGLSTKVNKTGDTLSGDLNMGSNDVNNISTTRTDSLVLGGVTVTPDSLDEAGVFYVKTKDDLKATPLAGLTDGQADKITTTGRAGDFTWLAGDQSGTLVLSTVASSSVNDGTDTVTATAHGLSTGDGVAVSESVNGLDSDNVYWVINIDANSFKLATSYANAQAGTAIDLTGTTNFTLYELLDPLEGVYVTLDGDRRGVNGVFKRNVSLRTITPESYGIEQNNINHDLYQAIWSAHDAGLSLDLSGGSYYQLSAGNRVARLLTSTPGATITCLTSRRLEVSYPGFYIGGGITVDFSGGDTEGWLLINDGAEDPTVDGLKFTNSHSSTFCNFITVSSYGVRDFNIKNISADDVDVDKNGMAGDQNGAMRLVLVISQGSTTSPLSNGKIRRVSCRNFGNDEDSDLIHISNLTETQVHNISIQNVFTHNVGKRAVKIQARGCTVKDIYSFNDSAEQQFSVVSHFSEDGFVENVTGEGNIRYGCEIISSSICKRVVLDSTSGTSVIVSAKGSPEIRDIKALGTCKNAILARPTSGNIEKLVVSGVTGNYSENVILLGMDTSGSGNSFNSAFLENVFAQTSSSTLNIIVASAFGGDNVGEVVVRNYRSDYSGTPYITAISLSCDTAVIEDAYNSTATGSMVNLINCTRVYAERVKTTSGTRAINLNSCSNTTCAACEGGSSEVVRIDGGNSHVCTSLITSVGGASTSQANSPTNVVDNNPVVRT